MFKMMNIVARVLGSVSQVHPIISTSQQKSSWHRVSVGDIIKLAGTDRKKVIIHSQTAEDFSGQPPPPPPGPVLCTVPRKKTLQFFLVLIIREVPLVNTAILLRPT